MPPGTGQNDGESRLDRVERILDAGLLRHEAAREEFDREHKRLLTAQVVFQENLNALELRMAATTEKVNALTEFMNPRRRSNQ